MNREKKPAKKSLTSSTDIASTNRWVPVKIVADDPMFLPLYKSKGAAAADLVANIPVNSVGKREVTLTPGNVETIDCGFSMALPPGWEAQIRCRSSLARKGIQVTNGIGTVDDDYRGRVAVILNNAGKEIVILRHGDRIGQMALKPVWYFQWQIVDKLDETERGTGGFGSTGV